MGTSPRRTRDYPVGRRKTDVLGQDWEARLAEARERRLVALAAREVLAGSSDRRDSPWDEAALDVSPDLVDERAAPVPRRRRGAGKPAMPDLSTGLETPVSPGPAVEAPDETATNLRFVPAAEPPQAKVCAPEARRSAAWVARAPAVLTPMLQPTEAVPERRRAHWIAAAVAALLILPVGGYALFGARDVEAVRTETADAAQTAPPTENAAPAPAEPAPATDRLARVAPRPRPERWQVRDAGPATFAALAAAGRAAPLADAAPQRPDPGMAVVMLAPPAAPEVPGRDRAMAVMPGGVAQTVQSSLTLPSGQDNAAVEGLAMLALPRALAAPPPEAVPAGLSAGGAPDRPVPLPALPRPPAAIAVALPALSAPLTPGTGAIRVALLDPATGGAAGPALVRPAAPGVAPVAAVAKPPAAPVRPAPPVATVFVHAPGSLDRGIVEEEAKRIASLTGLAVELRDPVGFKISASNVRFFHPEDRKAAAEVAGALSAQLRDFTAFQPSPEVGTIEVWLAGASQTAPAEVAAAPPPQPAKPALQQAAAPRSQPVRARPAPASSFETTTITRTRRSGIGRLFGN